MSRFQLVPVVEKAPHPIVRAFKLQNDYPAAYVAVMLGELSVLWFRRHAPDARNAVAPGRTLIYTAQVTVWSEGARPELTDIRGYERESAIHVVTVSKRTRRVRGKVPIVDWAPVIAAAFECHKARFVDPMLDMIAELPAPWCHLLADPRETFRGLLPQYDFMEHE